MSRWLAVSGVEGIRERMDGGIRFAEKDGAVQIVQICVDRSTLHERREGVSDDAQGEATGLVVLQTVFCDGRRPDGNSVLLTSSNALGDPR
jgi:hypothetical protein